MANFGLFSRIVAGNYYVALFLVRLQYLCFDCVVIGDYDYVFAENGLVAYKDGAEIGIMVTFITHV